jgi:hypothetical protein
VKPSQRSHWLTHAEILTLALSCAASAVARAEDPPSSEPSATAAQVQTAEVDTSPNSTERPFLFTVDPSLPAPFHAVLTAGMGNVTKTGEERPVGAGQIVPTLGVEYGLLSRLSLYAEGGVAFVQAGNPGQLSSPVIFEGGAHILLTDPSSRTWRVSLRPEYFYDFDGSSTLSLTATGAWYYRKVRVVASFQASHTFQTDADGVDLQATLGALYELPYGFRVGLEGVVSDLEEIVTPAAEGGSSAFAGPTVGWEYGRFQIVAGPAFGVTPGAIYDSFLVRAAACLRL